MADISADLQQELDQLQAAHFRKHKLHKEADYRKRLYEDALRREFYGF